MGLLDGKRGPLRNLRPETSPGAGRTPPMARILGIDREEMMKGLQFWAEILIRDYVAPLMSEFLAEFEKVSSKQVAAIDRNTKKMEELIELLNSKETTK